MNIYADVIDALEIVTHSNVQLTTLNRAFPQIWTKALHSELLTELSSRFSSRNEFGRLGHYQNISKIWKKSISETCENKNFGKNRLSQGLNLDKFNLFKFPCVWF